MDIGDVINGWRIVEDAGAGRSGHVFIVCREGDPDRLFALKKPRGQTPGRTSFLPRFCSDLARYLPRGGRETMQSHLWSRL